MYYPTTWSFPRQVLNYHNFSFRHMKKKKKKSFRHMLLFFYQSTLCLACVLFSGEKSQNKSRTFRTDDTIKQRCWLCSISSKQTQLFCYSTYACNKCVIRAHSSICGCYSTVGFFSSYLKSWVVVLHLEQGQVYHTLQDHVPHAYKHARDHNPLKYIHI